jgi:hypothetical protein
LVSDDFRRKPNIRTVEAFIDSLILEFEISPKLSNLFKVLVFVPVYFFSSIVLELPRFFCRFIFLSALFGFVYFTVFIRNSHSRYYEKTLAIGTLMTWAVINTVVLNTIRVILSFLPMFRGDFLLRNIVVSFIAIGVHVVLSYVGSELLKESPKIAKILSDGS